MTCQPFNGVPLANVFLLMSYCDLLTDDAIKHLAEHECTYETFNNPEYNKWFATALKKHNIFFESENGVEFTNNGKIIFFKVKDEQLLRFIVKNEFGDILIERIYFT
jgi:hypothetical protein